MIARALPHLSPSLIHCYPLMVRRASGCMVEDVDGNVYLDAEAGVATASTGHCHPAVAAAIAAQAEVLIHICGRTSTTRATARSARSWGSSRSGSARTATTGRRS